MDHNTQNGWDDAYLFDPLVLRDIDWESRMASFSPAISPTNPGDRLCIRPLHISDYDKGYHQLLEQLTCVGDVDNELFKDRFQKMRACEGTYYVVVIEDTEKDYIIGSASLIVEQKFIHTAGTRGRVEDVVVNADYRGRQLGKLLVEVISLLGKQLGCYKLSLECKEQNVKFYSSFGYAPDGQLFMVQRYSN